MKYNATQQRKTLFLQYHKEVSVTEQSYLMEAIRKLTSALLRLFAEQGQGQGKAQKDYLRKLPGMFRLITENNHWTCRSFTVAIVEKMRMDAKVETDPDYKKSGFELAEALEIIRNLFDGDTSFYYKTFPSFRNDQIEPAQVERIRKAMHTITDNHIKALIPCVEKELQPKGLFHTISESQPVDNSPQPVQPSIAT